MKHPLPLAKVLWEAGRASAIKTKEILLTVKWITSPLHFNDPDGICIDLDNKKQMCRTEECILLWTVKVCLGIM